MKVGLQYSEQRKRERASGAVPESLRRKRRRTHRVNGRGERINGRRRFVTPRVSTRENTCQRHGRAGPAVIHAADAHFRKIYSAGGAASSRSGEDARRHSPASNLRKLSAKRRQEQMGGGRCGRPLDNFPIRCGSSGRSHTRDSEDTSS